MVRKPVRVKFLTTKSGSEQSFFAEEDKRKLRKLRETAAKETNQKYSDEHGYTHGHKTHGQ